MPCMMKSMKRGSLSLKNFSRKTRLGRSSAVSASASASRPLLTLLKALPGRSWSARGLAALEAQGLPAGSSALCCVLWSFGGQRSASVALRPSRLCSASRARGSRSPGKRSKSRAARSALSIRKQQTSLQRIVAGLSAGGRASACAQRTAGPWTSETRAPSTSSATVPSTRTKKFSHSRPCCATHCPLTVTCRGISASSLRRHSALRLLRSASRSSSSLPIHSRLQPLSSATLRKPCTRLGCFLSSSRSFPPERSRRSQTLSASTVARCSVPKPSATPSPKKLPSWSRQMTLSAEPRPVLPEGLLAYISEPDFLRSSFCAGPEKP
mmetsp:Transcript_71566/g.222137  ORF Transcript_71566/g.222137 Transcript_71566/m.222137 type:complete len:325 (-) Transcript_71566:166-1140(-)